MTTKRFMDPNLMTKMRSSSTKNVNLAATFEQLRLETLFEGLPTPATMKSKADVVEAIIGEISEQKNPNLESFLVDFIAFINYLGERDYYQETMPNQPDGMNRDRGSISPTSNGKRIKSNGKRRSKNQSGTLNAPPQMQQQQLQQQQPQQGRPGVAGGASASANNNAFPPIQILKPQTGKNLIFYDPPTTNKPRNPTPSAQNPKGSNSNPNSNANGNASANANGNGPASPKGSTPPNPVTIIRRPPSAQNPPNPNPPPQNNTAKPVMDGPLPVKQVPVNFATANSKPPANPTSNQKGSQLLFYPQTLPLYPTSSSPIYLSSASGSASGSSSASSSPRSSPTISPSPSSPQLNSGKTINIDFGSKRVVTEHKAFSAF
uniref:Uncharacterized protein n=1 Tax=Arcella intermedia TaxID=1963864 RepID=A0A6B2L6I5_9EUKA